MSQTEITTANDPTTSGERRTEGAAPERAGRPLPGDRGPRDGTTQTSRPSFWRRIALGRRSTPVAETAPQAPKPPPAAAREPQPRATSLVERAREVVSAPPPPAALDAQAVETRIVEPMLQALVSVEAKLERSHSDLVGRSDQVEQRLTQLWAIEEQLGQLNELQVSLRQVAEQQRRLESAVVTQTTTLRWLVGAVFFSLAAAAFTVALLIRA